MSLSSLSLAPSLSYHPFRFGSLTLLKSVSCDRFGIMLRKSNKKSTCSQFCMRNKSVWSMITCVCMRWIVSEQKEFHPLPAFLIPLLSSLFSPSLPSLLPFFFFLSLRPPLSPSLESLPHYYHLNAWKEVIVMLALSRGTESQTQAKWCGKDNIRWVEIWAEKKITKFKKKHKKIWKLLFSLPLWLFLSPFSPHLCKVSTG